jgi:hypothetical protein
MMSSDHATKMNNRARVLLWRAHAETLFLEDGGSTRELLGTWRRVMPEGGENDKGSQGYQGTAMAVVKFADMPDLPGADAVFIRNDERWAIVHGEPQDEWTWILHLARPDQHRRIPSSRR